MIYDLLKKFNFFKRNNSKPTGPTPFGQVKGETFLFSWISEYFEKADKADPYNLLSEQVCNDLDFDEVFMFVDRSKSNIGQQYLYNHLRRPGSNGPINEEEEELIKKIEQDDELRLFLEKELCKLKSTETFYIAKLFQDKIIDPPKWYWLLPILSIFSLISIISLLFSELMFYIVPFILLTNMGIHYRNKNNLDHYISSLPELLKLKAVAKVLVNHKSGAFADEATLKSISRIENIKKHFSIFQMENRLQGDISNLSWGLFEVVKIILILEPILFFKALKQLNNNQDSIAQLFNFVGRVDMLYSIGALRSGLDKFCFPDFTEVEKGLKTEGIYHPLIENCVGNDLDTEGKSVLLTGSNMSGKTTFIRTIAVNLMVAKALNTCFAMSFQIPRLNLMSAIRISDDLNEEKSYYFEEVLTIKEMINRSMSDYDHLFLLDEIFKGTNTIERIAAGKAVLSYLANNSNLVFVSTHDIELADLLQEEYKLYHFTEVITDAQVNFDYKIKEGKLKTTNAINILKINEYPEQVIEDAFGVVDVLNEEVQGRSLLPK